MSDVEDHRNSEERLCAWDMVRLPERGRSSVLDIGTSEGSYFRLLTAYFETVTSLDVEMPIFGIGLSKGGHP